jgi:pyruvate dehydrogenase E2 component (dihydrolipoamide acetyltransferase)
MAVPVIMPRQGQSVESCIISEWTKQKGDKVEEGEVLCVYETDKASFELESPASGILLETFFTADDDVPVLANIAVIGKEGEAIDDFRPENATTTLEPEAPAEPATEEKYEDTSATTEKEEKAVPDTSQAAESDEFTRISPRAKAYLQKIGLTENDIKTNGSGPHGRILEQDVINYIEQHGKPTPTAAQAAKEEKTGMPATGTGLGGQIRQEDLGKSAAPAATTAPAQIMEDGADFTVKKLPNIRKIIAENMHKSLQNSAQLTHHLGADARKLLNLRKRVKAAQAEGKLQSNITLNDMICFAVIKALKKHPEANSHFLGDKIKTFTKVHLGLAVDTERGLMVPALQNADDFNLEGLSNQLKKIANDCKSGKIDPELLASTAASFTVSNLGAYGIEIFTPVINLPQSGILGVNTITHRPADLGDGTIGFVPYLGLSLTYDHRSLDGAPASRFLQGIQQEIENFEYTI